MAMGMSNTGIGHAQWPGIDQRTRPVSGFLDGVNHAHEPQTFCGGESGLLDGSLTSVKPASPIA
jgi:hypothetical protein